MKTLEIESPLFSIILIHFYDTKNQLINFKNEDNKNRKKLKIKTYFNLQQFQDMIQN